MYATFGLKLSTAQGDHVADSEQLSLIHMGVAAWNKWRQENPQVIPDLCGAKLFQEDLRGVNLRDALLNQVDLRGANLDSASLSGTRLCGARLTGANLTFADLRGADLRKASLHRATLGAARLEDALLNHSMLTGASLTGANLDRVDFRNAALDDVDLQHTSVDGANFDAAIFGQTILGFMSLARAQNLETASHVAPSVIDFLTLERSGPLPVNFLRGCGVPETLIEYLPSLLNRAIEYYSCFISYSNADKSFARRLHDQLQARGIRCWLDEHQILPGDDLHDSIQRGIKLWDKVLLCCSRASLQSWWVDNEIETAFRKERELMAKSGRKTLVLVPLDLDGYVFSGEWHSGKEEQVRARLAADFRSWESDNEKFEVALEKLTMALRADLYARKPAPKSRL